MTPSDTGVSLTTATAIALGAMQATDLAKQALRDVGLGNIPAQVKALGATALAVAASMVLEQNTHRRVLTACAAAGLASMLHTADRLVRARGDIDRVIFTEQATRLGLRSRVNR